MRRSRGPCRGSVRRRLRGRSGLAPAAGSCSQSLVSQPPLPPLTRLALRANQRAFNESAAGYYSPEGRPPAVSGLLRRVGDEGGAPRTSPDVLAASS